MINILLAWDIIGGGYIIGAWLALRSMRPPTRYLEPFEPMSYCNAEHQARLQSDMSVF